MTGLFNTSTGSYTYPHSTCATPKSCSSALIIILKYLFLLSLRLLKYLCMDYNIVEFDIK